MDCYICNKELKNKGAVSNSEKETETHQEHIIQNALRGKLSSDKILCSKCGNDLNTSIDVGFIKYFSPITELLDKFSIRKDHGNNNASPVILGRLMLGEFDGFDVNYKDGVIAAHKPVYYIDLDNKLVTIIANEKIAAQLEEKAKKELSAKGEDISTFRVKKITDFKDGIFMPYFGKGVLDINSAIFNGFVKIAVEFALVKGVRRDELNRAIEIGDDVITFFPQGSIDKIFEFYRPLLEPNYPTHTLMLFTEERRNSGYVLYCYIELFSTYQAYVILNNNFYSPVYESYYQPVLKDELLSDKESQNLSDTLREIHKRFLKILDKTEPLDEIESNIANGLETLPEDLVETLDGEIDAIENIIMNQNFYNDDFNDLSKYDLTVAYKRHFFNQLLGDCDSTPKFLIKASNYANESLIEYVEKYNTAKVSKLLETIQILRAITEDD
jgi:hypothetical protein